MARYTEMSRYMCIAYDTRTTPVTVTCHFPYSEADLTKYDVFEDFVLFVDAHGMFRQTNLAALFDTQTRAVVRANSINSDQLNESPERGAAAIIGAPYDVARFAVHNVPEIGMIPLPLP